MHWSVRCGVLSAQATGFLRSFARALVVLVLVPVCCLAQAQIPVSVENPWVRASVPGQKGTAVFMTLRAAQGARLLSVSSPVAAYAEVHEMRMDGDVMQMRPLADGLELPAGKPVALTPGGYHIMLMDLKSQLKVNTTVPLTLVFKDARGQEGHTDLAVPVRSMSTMDHMH